MLKQRAGGGDDVGALACVEDQANVGDALLLKNVGVKFALRTRAQLPVDLALRIARLILPNPPEIDARAALPRGDRPRKAARLRRTNFEAVEPGVARMHNQMVRGSVEH